MCLKFYKVIKLAHLWYLYIGLLNTFIIYSCDVKKTLYKDIVFHIVTSL